MLFASGVVSMVATQSRTIGHYADVPPDAYAVVAEVRGKPGKEQALREATLPLIAPGRRVDPAPVRLVRLLGALVGVPRLGRPGSGAFAAATIDTQPHALLQRT